MYVCVCSQLYYPATCGPEGHGSCPEAVSSIAVHDLPISLPRPAIFHATVMPCRPSGAYSSPTPGSAKEGLKQKKGQRKDKGNMYKDIGKNAFSGQARPALLSPVPCSLGILKEKLYLLHRPSLLTLEGTRVTTLPTFVGQDRRGRSLITKEPSN